jgi:hypothetical protein
MNKVKIEEAIGVLLTHAVTKVVPRSFKKPALVPVVAAACL